MARLLINSMRLSVSWICLMRGRLRGECPIDDLREDPLNEDVDTFRRRRVDGIMPACDRPPYLPGDLRGSVDVHLCMCDEVVESDRGIGPGCPRGRVGDANAGLLPFPAQRIRKAAQREFRGGIAGKLWIGDVAKDRADVDHPRWPCCQQQKHQIARQRHWRDDVGEKCSGIRIASEFLDGTALDHARIVDEYVECFPLLADDLDDPAAMLGICYIRRNDQMLMSLVEQRASCLKCGLAPPAQRNGHPA